MIDEHVHNILALNLIGQFHACHLLIGSPVSDNNGWKGEMTLDQA